MRRLTFVAVLALQLSLVAGQGQPVESLFIVDQKSCANYLTRQANGVSILQQIVNEAAAMVQSAHDMLRTATTSQNSAEYISGLFNTGPQNPAVQGTMRSEYWTFPLCHKIDGADSLQGRLLTYRSTAVIDRTYVE